jgi:hypothetical protein
MGNDLGDAVCSTIIGPIGIKLRAGLVQKACDYTAVAANSSALRALESSPTLPAKRVVKVAIKPNLQSGDVSLYSTTIASNQSLNIALGSTSTIFRNWYENGDDSEPTVFTSIDTTAFLLFTSPRSPHLVRMIDYVRSILTGNKNARCSCVKLVNRS